MADTPKQPRYSLRALMLLTLAAAVFMVCTFALYRAGRSKAGYGPYPSEAEWPRALQAFVKEEPSFRTHVTPYGLGEFIDHRSIWRFDPGSPLLEHMISNTNLESVDDDHPKSSELIDNLPSGWPSFDWGECEWYATPGYGARHIEGIDLYLIAVDETSGAAIALHEWLF